MDNGDGMRILPEVRGLCSTDRVDLGVELLDLGPVTVDLLLLLVELVRFVGVGVRESGNRLKDPVTIGKVYRGFLIIGFNDDGLALELDAALSNELAFAGG